MIKTDELAYVLGLDWFGFSDTLLSTQLFQSNLNNHHIGMLRDERDTTLTFLIKRDYMNETLTTELLWLHNLDLDDGLARGMAHGLLALRVALAHARHGAVMGHVPATHDAAPPEDLVAVPIA